MKINCVEDFVRTNISRIQKDKNNKKVLHLYDKNNLYRGQCSFFPLASSGYYGLAESMSVVRIMDNSLKQTMQQIIYMRKNYIKVKDKTSNVLTKAVPFEITIIKTVLDFVHDKFLTTKSVIKLTNQLQRIGKDDPDFIYTDRFPIYGPLKGIPQYKTKVEKAEEGNISETKKNNLSVPCYCSQARQGWTHQIPYRYR